MAMRGRGILMFTLAASSGIACSSSLQLPDAAGSGGADAAGGPCIAADMSFPATPAGPDAPPCTFQLPTPTVCSGNFSVQLDNGQFVTTDPENGWSYTDVNLRTIQIRGPVCDQITAGAVQTICITYQCISDRDAKRDFAPIDREAILDRLSRLPLSTWSYKSDGQRTRHIGPMAQDFKLTFDVGANDKTIFPLDESGVAFAAIQALDQRLKRLEDENARLKKQIAALRTRARPR